MRIIVNGEDSVRVGALLSGQAHIARQIPALDEARIQARAGLS